ncbi:Phosphoglucomutase @ Phosphomannomutase [hydrothermal vent metagenome]|uniref:Phosphoglucomutase @ Phosphomannomutase n=1 Tax=hydrothermal vent metagenome TaxID=652676 RepID=A0A3B1BDP1_9ZZZZ
MMNRNIFREYDIRGVVEKDLTPDVVKALGCAFGTVIKRNRGHKVSIGRDARISSPKLFELLAEGIISTGIDVIDIGLVPTPSLYFSLYHLNTDGGVMITGSHNPPEFNGFKLNLGFDSIHGAGIQKLADIIEAEDFETGAGSIIRQDVIEDYIKMVKEKITLKRKLKIVVDSGNGCGGIFAPRLLKELGCEVIELFCDVDGTFPNHHPDPTVPDNLKDIIAKVRETGADVGFAYDGDADRIGVVDENGGILFGDQLMMIFARDILTRKPGAAIVYDVKCSQNLEDDIKKHGGKPVINATGHSLIKARLKKENAELAGEMSAHIFFKEDYFGYDDAIFATARFLRIMSETDKKVSEFLADTPKVYNTPEIRVDCPDDKKFKLIEDITAYFKKDYDVVDIDGARVNFGDGWGLIRASNTQPVVVMRFEAQSEKRLDELRKIFYEKLISYKSMENTAPF